jgi:Ran GTPase-activating protein (RanGAP) involved in mRNA processing and transport
MDSVRCLSRSLKSHTRINELHLNYCDLGSTLEILSVLLQSDVKNNIDSLGAIKIAEYIGRNPPIQRIELSENRLNDDDAMLISQTLKRNTNLKLIHLDTNNFTTLLYI